MEEAKHELVRAWLIKAGNDLTSARLLGTAAEGPLDTAIYHCQQAAEKAAKAFLAYKDHRLERSHDIERLVELASAYDPKFISFEDSAIILTPYATAYRYPGESAILEPSRTEFDEALQLAATFVDFVRSLLPDEVKPSLPGR